MDEQTYIAAYFEGLLPEEERASFEKRCVEDPLFAREVADYVIISDALRAELHEQKRNDFAVLYTSLSTEGNADPEDQTKEPQSYFTLKRLVIYGATACLALVVVWLTIVNHQQPKELADVYVAKNFEQLSVTMGLARHTRMQEGIDAFNRKEYSTALGIFESLYRDSTLKAEAVKNMGITQLMQGSYSDAIDSFDRLSKMDLFTNPGLFYKAIAFMKRAGPGDQDAARGCLKGVVKGNLAGRKQAEIWLEKL